MRNSHNLALIGMLCLAATAVGTPFATAQEALGEDGLRHLDGRRETNPGLQGLSYPGSQTLALEVPAEELLLSELFEPVPAMDGELYVFGTLDGQAAVVVLEDFQLQSLYSSDAGASFSSEVIAAGGTNQPAVQPGVAVTRGPAGWLYAAIRVADPGGDIGLQFVRSDDMGQTWSAPLDLLTSADAIHGAGAVRIAANESGRVAVAFTRSWGSNPFVRVSSDHGATWTEWVRVDPGVAEGSAGIHDVDLAVDGGGIVHVVFDQTRAAGREIFYTRSTDGGTSFEAERSLDPALPPGGRIGSENPDIAIAADGGVLVAFWDGFDDDRIYVLRSGDAGVSFALALQRVLSGTGRALRPTLATHPDTAVVLVGVVDILDGAGKSGPLSVHQSVNHGSTFGAEQVLATEAIDASGAPPLAMVRTPAGDWAVAWRDGRDDDYLNQLADMYARVSIDGGASWDLEQQVDGTGPGVANVSLGGMSHVFAANLLVAYCDTRDDPRDANVYTNQSPAAVLNFSTDEQRIDSDARTRNARAFTPSSIAWDGADHLYVALQAYADGFFPDVHVAASADLGYSFTTPHRVSTSPAGELSTITPQVVATSDGNVYVAFRELDPATMELELRFNHSSDFGVTWQPQDELLGITRSSAAGFSHPEFQLEALSSGRVFVVWSDGTDIFLARSTDAGATFAVEDVDQDSLVGRISGHPTLCGQGDRLVLVFRGRAELAPGYASIWGTVSDDAGANWTPRTELRPGGNTVAVLPHVACNDTGEAVAVWSDRRSDAYHVYANRHDGSSWQGSVAVGAPPTSNQFHPEVAYASSNDVAVAFYDLDWSIHTSYSTHGGASFANTEIHDDVGVNPAAVSVLPNLATDGLGNVWLSWRENSAGLPSIVARHSADGGQTWGAIRRLNRELPQGGYSNDYWVGHAYSTAVPGAAFFSWSGQRTSLFAEAIVNAYDLDDFDRDGIETGIDCDDENPGVAAVPAEVIGVVLDRLPEGVRVSWTEQSASAGPATTYDVVTGALVDLVTGGGFSGATCLVDDHALASYDDETGEGNYYLVRAQNACGFGTFGDSSQTPDPRDAIEAALPCP